MACYFGIDLGGTNIAAAAVDGEGRILGRGRRSTPRTGPEDVADAMAEAVREAAGQAGAVVEEAAGIGRQSGISLEKLVELLTLFYQEGP